MDEQTKNPSCDGCPKCAERAQLEEAQAEMHFALLLALVPLMVVTLFGQMGLF